MNGQMTANTFVQAIFLDLLRYSEDNLRIENVTNQSEPKRV